MRYLSSYKTHEKKSIDYMIKPVDNVPSPIKSYCERIFKDVESKFNDWFFRKSLANYSNEIIYQWNDIKEIISPDDFKNFPLEDIFIKLKFKTTGKHSKDYEENGMYRNVEDMVDFVDTSFKQTSASGIVKESYLIQIDISISIPKSLTSIDINLFNQRIKSLIYHEMAHAYDNIQSGGISTARSHVINSYNIKCLSIASTAISDLVYLAYLSGPEEVYANIIGAYGFNSMEDYKKHWIYDEIIKLKKFKAVNFIKKLKSELPKDAEWESNDFGKTRYYQLPQDFPNLFTDYHDIMLKGLSKFKMQRKYDHSRYSKLRNLSLEEFAKYWENEFNTVAKIYIENIQRILKSKKN